MNATLRLAALIFGLWFMQAAQAIGDEALFGDERLPSVDEAINVMADADWARQRLLVSFSLIDSVYLYRHRFDFSLQDRNGNVLSDFAAFSLPAGKPKHDEVFGDVEVFYNQLDLTLPLDSVPLADTVLVVDYQGCIENKLCYPPATKRFEFASAQPATATKASPPVANGAEGGFIDTLRSEDANAFNRWLEDRSLALIIGLFFVGGLLLAFTPCVFPMVPILSGIIAGDKRPSAARGFSLSLAYVLGVAVPYTLAGLLVALFGARLNLQFILQQPAAIITSAVVFVLLALSMFGLYELQLPGALRDRLNRLGPSGKGKLYSAAVMGAISALVVSPCVTPILAGALIYVAASGDAATGAASLFALSIGMGVPLILFGTGGGHVLPRAGMWMEEIKRLFGVLMLGVAIWLLDRILDDSLTLGLYGLLLAVYGVQLGALEPVKEGGSRLRRALALVMALYGAVMVVGAAGGGTDPLQPLQHYQATQTTPEAASQTDGAWTSLQGRPALENALQRSINNANPVLVDFFAEWCVACRVLEETTLSDPTVLQALGGFDLYRVDITEINQENQAIMEQYQIFGLPSLVFFTPDGQEIPESRVLGEMDAERFTKHLNKQVIPAISR